MPVSTVVPTPNPNQVTVEAWDDYFRPEDITVTVGTLVVWINKGSKKHTVTSGDLFDTDILVGQTFSFTFNQRGTYEYYCVIHSLSETDGMVGTVTVVTP